MVRCKVSSEFSPEKIDKICFLIMSIDSDRSIIKIVVHTFHMQVSLSSNGHEKTKETSKYKKLLISKRRIGILKKLPKQGKDSESL